MIWLLSAAFLTGILAATVALGIGAYVLLTRAWSRAVG